MKKLILLTILLTINLFSLKAQMGLYFPPTGTGHAVVPHNLIYNVGIGDFTIEAWVLINLNGFGDQTIFSNDELSGGPGVQFLYVYDSQFPHLKLRTNTGIIVANTPNLADGICHHVTVVKSTNNLVFYLDGSLIYSHLGGGGLFDINNSNDIYIGAQNYAGFLFDFFHGSIRDLRYWSVARTQAEIQQNMYALSGTTGLLGSFAPGIETAVWPATYSTDCQSCTPLPSPVTITANGPTTFCNGNSVTLSSNAPAGLNFAWRTTDVSTPILGNGSTLNVTTSSEYFLFVTNTCGTVVSNSIYVNVTGQPPSATITASGPTTVCLGGSVTLNTNTATGLSYQWQLNGNNILGATTNSYSASSTGNYSVIVSNTCGSSSSNVISVDVDSVTVYLTYQGNFPCPGQCNGALFVLDTMTTGIPPFTYLFSGAGTITQSPGQTSITGLCALDNVGVVVTDANGCTASDFRIVVPVTPQNPNISIAPACNLNNGSVTISGIINFPWNISLKILDSSYAFITNAPQLTPVNLPAGSYILEITSSGYGLVNPCPQYFPFTIPVGITIASITVSGSTNICSGSSVTLDANTGTGLSYQWQLNGSNIIGANSSSYSATFAGNYSVVVTDSCGSNTSNTIAVTVNSAPTASITASGSTSICAGSSVTLNANTGTGLTYQWKLNGNNISGATSPSYSAANAGNYTVVVSNLCGSSTSNVITVTTGAAPSAAITASGSTSICAGSFVTLIANTGTGLNYQWQLNGSNINGATSSTYNSTTSGNYSVIVSDSCGNSISNIITVNVISAPGSAGAISGPTSFCRHSTQSFSVSPVTGATNYIWSVPQQAQIVSGQGSNSIVVSFIVKQGDITVKASNSCGSGPLSVLPVQLVKCANPNSNNPNSPLRTAFNTLIYPNPSLNDFNCEIQGEADQIFSLHVFDYSGRIVELKEDIVSYKNFTFGNDLAPGFYFVEINSGDVKEIYKVVKVN